MNKTKEFVEGVYIVDSQLASGDELTFVGF